MSQDEEVLGKAYDARLIRRLLTYLRPYRPQVGVALHDKIAAVLKKIEGPQGVTAIFGVNHGVQPQGHGAAVGERVDAPLERQDMR